MEQEQKENKVRELVADFFIKDAHLSLDYKMPVEDAQHIVQIGTSILLHKWGIVNYKAGSFVQKFLDNDLEGTFAHADSVNAKAVFFYVRLVANVGIPKELQRSKK